MQNSNLYYGYFPDFSTPTLLFFGDGEALEFLQKTIKLLSANSKQYSSSNSSRFVPINEENLMIVLNEEKTGIKILDRKTLEWNIPRSQIPNITKRISDVASSEKAQHDYLDIPGDEAEVKISIGEYDINSFRSV
ncbi:hypothetical protein IQ254_27940 [Nodosilinea sp. LEGE 07088]|uniref:hypothetical protein n=1 Tax=Nodosilinea sp. LEGE 07088 TaxID=2777968 RepID=UPI00187EBCC1|nr:hypothetical protein [Nodosilinea sp. LEGE 07088]MBE9140986.1 hypothetical protein [Nodosilinea sp. LEGE 07088]